MDIRGPSGSAAKAGLYIHFPFCREKCPYCHFTSRPYAAGEEAAWLAGLEREAALYACLPLTFDTLYIGGGTPSLLDPAAVADLRRRLGSVLALAPEEFTLEANPFGESAKASLAGWAEAGVSRLSVGIQSFDDGVLRILERDYSAARALSFAREAKAAGFVSVSWDLMVGVPGETERGRAAALDAVSALSPDHVSLYLLENVEGLPFEEVLRARPVSEDEAAEAFEFLAAGLEAQGIRRYEISNFSRPGSECRHNLKYWRFEPFLGLGPSAASHIGAERWSDLEGPDAWSAALAAGSDPRAEITALDGEEATVEALVSGLRLVSGIDLEEFRRRFGIDPAERHAGVIRDLQRGGMIVAERGRLRIPEERLLVSNAILSRFV